MNKVIKKISIAMLMFFIIILLHSTKVSAYATSEEEAFNEFSEQENNVTYNLYLGERIPVVDWDITNYLTPTITIKDKNIAKSQEEYGTYYVVGKKVGSTKVTVSVTYNEKTIKKNLTIKVKKTSTSTKLDSKTNDVVSITGYSKTKTKVLLANGELWNTDSSTFKLTKKSTGNVAKYVYTDIYYFEGDNSNSNVKNFLLTLKKDKKLTIESTAGTKVASGVKELSSYGFLTTKGDYYAIVLKNGKIATKKKISGVSKLAGDYLLIKGNKLYTVGNRKISDLKVTDAKGTCGRGLILTTDNKLYAYTYDYDKDTYSTKKVATKVKELLNENLYVTKSGETKRYKFSEYDTTEDNVLDTLWIADSVLTIKTNKCLYLNSTKILDKVEDMTHALGTKYNSALIVRQDGSIWRLDLGGKAKLSKIRSGKDSNKKISKPTNVKVSQSGKTTAKVSWKKVDGATKYTVYRATSKNGTYKKVGTTTSSSYKDKKVKKGKTYYYKVVANTSKSLYNSDKTSAVKIKIKK